MPGSWLGRKLSMMAFLRSSPRFSVLVRALELTELSPSLEVKPCFGNWEYEKSLFQAGAGGPFTLFAPTNSAFDLVVTTTLSSMWLTQWSWNYYKVGREAMLGDVPSLRKALLRHIVRLTKNMIIRVSVTFFVASSPPHPGCIIFREKLPSLSFPVGVSQVDTASREKATIAVSKHNNNQNTGRITKITQSWKLYKPAVSDLGRIAEQYILRALPTDPQEPS